MEFLTHQCLIACLVVVYYSVSVHSESSTCFIEATQNYGFCKHGCCGVSLDNNQRCCDPPDIREWVVAVGILGGVLAITWLVCIVCLVHKAIKNSKKVKIRVHPSKKAKKKEGEKKTQFVNPTPEGYFEYPPQYQPTAPVQPLAPIQPPRLKSSLKNVRTSHERGEKKENKSEAKLYPVKKTTEFTQVAYQPPSRSSGLPEWASTNQESGMRGYLNEAGREREVYKPPQTPESYY